jgi:hypothetical protein
MDVALSYKMLLSTRLRGFSACCQTLLWIESRITLREGEVPRLLFVCEWFEFKLSW